MFQQEPYGSCQKFSLPDQDSNLECEDQNLVCYQLHHRVATERLSCRYQSNVRTVAVGRKAPMDFAGGLSRTCRALPTPRMNISYMLPHATK